MSRKRIRFVLLAILVLALIASCEVKSPSYSPNPALQFALLDPALRSGEPVHRPLICYAIGMTEAVGWGCYGSTAEKGPPAPHFDLPAPLRVLMHDPQLRERYVPLEIGARKALGTCYAQGRNPDRCEMAYLDRWASTHGSLGATGRADLKAGIDELQRQIDRAVWARRTAKRFGGNINGQTTTVLGNLFLQDDFNQSLAAARKQGACALWIRHWDHNRCSDDVPGAKRGSSPSEAAVP